MTDRHKVTDRQTFMGKNNMSLPEGADIMNGYMFWAVIYSAIFLFASLFNGGRYLKESVCITAYSVNQILKDIFCSPGILSSKKSSSNVIIS